MKRKDVWLILGGCKGFVDVRARGSRGEIGSVWLICVGLLGILGAEGRI